ncbi:hypothetical protein LG299_11805 [Microbacterium lacus]|uniref:hypothetical protein n=1 Tax=Microbacterium lacus TaxID=415217 RepID=UPI00384EE170
MVTVETLPGKRGPARRAWLRRAALIGLLPPAAVAVGVMVMFGTHIARATGDATLVSVAGVLLLVVGVIAIVALLDSHTRVSGVFALVIAAIFNPVVIGSVIIAVNGST